ncbi:hypothetical protein A2567_02560 [Candidatus Azambacteria bacterium RIFOXYD1_FULL_42_11]|uniref:Large ribosomal subunit protein bL25 n=4 Tax=Candidatus Azamiibacteriota TaxID=1752741 RepID=A0A0G1BHZ3_9BACT|nr:MAG: 50S ribosomal protein L25 [Candidatus Azambacteria bacterium GW2011_GWB1_42_17]KKS45921.1 MAG: 50S ribosomal protein L25 [Candidatus Azambacteria bacterium GW2011_GWA1_42_19]KKS75016.1 MAG: 50S ribosomal protein L25 [Candidatus Azambacteria bacterium GW2011_GWA2_42_9]KKS88642.1 MAG: ribosomal 5S rRNA E-loop-binding protein Ctc/L25/TL5, large subunit ribosomal protein L25 [Parcubacteria group bacterium GW2011_GWC1_43_11]OGD43313.1 MAG: hypothetical protein A2567_02560 [Candidatus Azambac
MTTLELKSEKRNILGKKVKTLRDKGLVPAVVYGGKDSGLSITVNAKEFNKIFKMAGETTLIKLFIDDKPKNVLIYDTARDPMTNEIKHVDFYEVKMDEKIIKKVPLNFVGSSPAVNELGGVLVKAMQELEVRALPADLPHEIQVDISNLKTFDDNILIQDVNLPKNIEALENIETSVASIIPPRSEAELEALSGAVEEKVEEIKVETEEKAKEREEEKIKTEA